MGLVVVRRFCSFVEHVVILRQQSLTIKWHLHQLGFAKLIPKPNTPGVGSPLVGSMLQEGEALLRYTHYIFHSWDCCPAYDDQPSLSKSRNPSFHGHGSSHSRCLINAAQPPTSDGRDQKFLSSRSQTSALERTSQGCRTCLPV